MHAWPPCNTRNTNYCCRSTGHTHSPNTAQQGSVYKNFACIILMHFFLALSSCLIARKSIFNMVFHIGYDRDWGPQKVFEYAICEVCDSNWDQNDWVSWRWMRWGDRSLNGKKNRRCTQTHIHRWLLGITHDYTLSAYKTLEDGQQPHCHTVWPNSFSQSEIHKQTLKNSYTLMLYLSIYLPPSWGNTLWTNSQQEPG